MNEQWMCVCVCLEYGECVRVKIFEKKVKSCFLKDRRYKT